MNKKLLIATVAAASIVGVGLTAQRTFAADSGSNDDLISRIATKFNLNKADVQTVFNDYKSEKDTERTAKEAERLTQAVTDGNITEAQKKLIEDKQAEMKTQMDAIHNETDAATRKAKTKELMDGLKTWAADNKIDLKWLRPAGGHRGPGGPGREMGDRADTSN